MRRCIGALACLFAAALLLAAAPPALVEVPPPEAPSVGSDLDSFSSSVKAQTLRAVAAAHRTLKRTEQKFAAFKARMRSKIETLRAALSDQKANVATLTRDAATTLEAWKAVATQSWEKMQASAADTLERIAAWMRGPHEMPAKSETRA